MNLRKWVKEREWSIKFFAALIKVDPSYIRRWFRGDCVPSEEIMDEIRSISMGRVSETKDLKDEEKDKTLTKKKQLETFSLDTMGKNLLS